MPSTKLLALFCSMSKALFIVIEGLDGSGKSTLAKSLAEAIGAVHIQTPLKLIPSAQDPRGVIYHDDRPGALSTELRSAMDAVVSVSPDARVLFYASLVLAAQVHVIRLLEEGRNVVCDRWIGSTIAYGLAMGASGAVQNLIYQVRRPDLTLFVATSLELRKQRMLARGELTVSDHWSMHRVANEKLNNAYGEVLHAIGGRNVALNGSCSPSALLNQAIAEVEWS